MYDSRGTEQLQSQIEAYEAKYGFATHTFIERIKNANDTLCDVPDAVEWFQAHRSLTRSKLQRGMWEGGVGDEFERMEIALDRRSTTEDNGGG